MNISLAPIHKIDVLIIGGGPVGLTAGLWLGQQGYKVVIIEKYAQTRGKQRAFNERRQQIGLDPSSLKFLRKLNSVVWGKIKAEGCHQDDWINLPIYRLQDILYTELLALPNVKFVFSAQVEAATTPYSGQNARITIGSTEGMVSFFPELVIVTDGRHDDGTAKNFFGFPPASQVTLSTYGIIGMIRRYDHPGKLCLTNYSSDNYQSQYGPMHVRLLGSLQERYIALGVADSNQIDRFKKLTSEQINQLLLEAYHQLKDPEEPELDKFDQVSETPILIRLDYRKETIKIFGQSNTIVSVEGDAARKTTFFSGSGLNSAYLGLDVLFAFIESNKSLIFNSDDLLLIDEKLLEKDRSSLDVSLKLLRKGINFIIDPNHRKCCQGNPEVEKVKPNRVEAGTLIYLKGSNLLFEGQLPKVRFVTDYHHSYQEIVTAYPNKLAVKVPEGIKGEVKIELEYPNYVNPVNQTIIVEEISLPPVISDVKQSKDGFIIIGDNFTSPIHLQIDQQVPIKAYCSSIDKIRVSPDRRYQGDHQLKLITRHGESLPYNYTFNDN